MALTFRPAYQGGPAVELLGPSGSNPLKDWTILPSVVASLPNVLQRYIHQKHRQQQPQQRQLAKTYVKDVKGYAFVLDQSVKLTMPKTQLSQPYFAIQVWVHPTKPVAFELCIADANNNHRRLFFNSAVKEIRVTPLHVTVPFCGLRREEWITLVVDIPQIVQRCFKGQIYRSIVSITISASCKLRRIFTVKELLYTEFGVELPLPSTFQFPRGVPNHVQMVGADGAFDADQYQSSDAAEVPRLDVPLAPLRGPGVRSRDVKQQRVLNAEIVFGRRFAAGGMVGGLEEKPARAGEGNIEGTREPLPGLKPKGTKTPRTNSGSQSHSSATPATAGRNSRPLSSDNLASAAESVATPPALGAAPNGRPASSVANVGGPEKTFGPSLRLCRLDSSCGRNSVQMEMKQPFAGERGNTANTAEVPLNGSAIIGGAHEVTSRIPGAAGVGHQTKAGVARMSESSDPRSQLAMTQKPELDVQFTGAQPREPHTALLNDQSEDSESAQLLAGLASRLMTLEIDTMEERPTAASSPSPRGQSLSRAHLPVRNSYCVTTAGTILGNLGQSRQANSRTTRTTVDDTSTSSVREASTVGFTNIDETRGEGRNKNPSLVSDDSSTKEHGFLKYTPEAYGGCSGDCTRRNRHEERVPSPYSERASRAKMGGDQRDPTVSPRSSLSNLVACGNAAAGQGPGQGGQLAPTERQIYRPNPDGDDYETALIPPRRASERNDARTGSGGKRRGRQGPCITSPGSSQSDPDAKHFADSFRSYERPKASGTPPRFPSMKRERTPCQFQEHTCATGARASSSMDEVQAPASSELDHDEQQNAPTHGHRERGLRQGAASTGVLPSGKSAGITSTSEFESKSYLLLGHLVHHSHTSRFPDGDGGKQPLGSSPAAHTRSRAPSALEDRPQAFPEDWGPPEHHVRPSHVQEPEDESQDFDGVVSVSDGDRTEAETVSDGLAEGSGEHGSDKVDDAGRRITAVERDEDEGQVGEDIGGDEDDEEVSLVYDADLRLYIDPISGKYYDAE